MVTSEARRHRFDAQDGVNDARVGHEMGQRLKKRLRALGISLPADARYLALGIGQAKPEMGLAQALDIPHSQIVLVDKKFSPEAKNRFDQIEFAGGIVRSDIYSYLETNSVYKPKYDLVSLFSLDYVFETKEEQERLIQGLAANMNRNGVVAAFPLFVPDGMTFAEVMTLWERYGFESLPDTPFSYYEMVLRNPPGEAK